jgi:cytochrome P450 family 135
MNDSPPERVFAAALRDAALDAHRHAPLPDPVQRGLPPGPRAPALAQSLAYLLAGERFIDHCLRRYGDLFTLKITGLGTIVALANPADVKTVFTAGPDALDAGSGNRPIEILLGSRSLLVLDGAEHMRQRKLMLPPFHGERLQRYRELIDELAEDTLDSWPVNRPFPLLPEMQRLTLEIILRVVFGVDDAERHAALRDRIRALVGYAGSDEAGIRYALRRFGALRLWRGFRRAHARADKLIYEEIARRRAQPTGGEDVLSLLLEARHEDGTPMTDQELRDQLVTLLVAGHETTATGLAWAFELLTRHPEAMARLTEEAIAGQDEDYANAVVQETLRLRPPVGVMARRVRTPFVVGGYELPPGARIVPGIAAVNQHPEAYPEPEAFRPERFLEHAPETYAWIPFGGGIRRCIGASLAQLEMRRVLHVVLRRAWLRPAGSRPDRPVRRAIVYPPRRGARVVLESRGPRPSDSDHSPTLEAA